MKKLMILIISMLMILTACGGNSTSTSQHPNGSGSDSKNNSESGSNSKPVILEALTFVPINEPYNKFFQEFIDEVDKRSNGQLHINIKGGPEVVPASEQLNALSRNTVDIVHSSPGYLFGIVPESWLTLVTSPWVPEDEMRNLGIDEMYNKGLKEKVNSFMLGLTSQGGAILMSNKEFHNVSLSGQKIRVSSYYSPIMQNLGASAIGLNLSELPGALNQGLVDGAVVAMPVPDATLGLTKYAYLPVFHRSQTGIFINNDVYNGLSEEHQTILKEVMAEIEKKQLEYWKSSYQDEIERIEKSGTQVIQLSDADADQYIQVANDSVSEVLVNATTYDKAQIKDLLVKITQLRDKYPE